MTPHKQVGWGPCPKGEWQKLSAGLSFRRHCAQALQLAAGVLIATAIAGGTWITAASLRPRAVQESISCHPEMPPLDQPDCHQANPEKK
jgi:hypothetical protein